MISPRFHSIGSSTSITPWKWSGMHTQACVTTRLPCAACRSAVWPQNWSISSPSAVGTIFSQPPSDMNEASNGSLPLTTNVMR
ncbi:MAG: hypothetical protein VZQ98_00665 [Bacteroidales bacterium]|nr:hypothetical protein [Bacteroidales bacterium]